MDRIRRTTTADFRLRLVDFRRSTDADVLYVQPEDAGKFGQVVDVAAGCQQGQHVAGADGLALFGVQAVAGAVAVFVGQEGGPVGAVVEREAHLVQRVALHGHATVKQRGAGDVVVHGRVSVCWA